MTDQENKPQEDQKEQPQRQPYYHEEKTEEKYEKEDEKREEKHTSDPLSSLMWALILIWAGVAFLANNLGWLSNMQSQLRSVWNMPQLDLSTWWVIFLGAGVIVFVEALIRSFVPAYRSSTGGNYFLAAVFMGIGLGGIFGWGLTWPFVLIGVGLASLVSALVRSRK
jgi:cation transport ATPase